MDKQDREVGRSSEVQEDGLYTILSNSILCEFVCAF